MIFVVTYDINAQTTTKPCSLKIVTIDNIGGS